ncbi:FeoB small GTPase domain-containing protein [Magnetovibrio blakemorei]|uniref:FeoB-type G domain-containing protein n=1 Tax=Magnetovibrio blakemorei TaxID=28181 RepID=A0A1E5Q5R0_9PROT|nr:FeoB small GTPase domain-containing protein [Magnetovibrio blakemorei]OEJ65908.1 hypothetical protein BEN30_13520 [Magnetovibrio blakemorei]
MGRPRVYALNMVDEMHKKGYSIDCEELSSMLGGTVVETVATTGQGLEPLLDALVLVAEQDRQDHPMRIPYDHHLEEAIERVQKLTADLHPGGLEAQQSRWLSIGWSKTSCGPRCRRPAHSKQCRAGHLE